MGAAYTSLHQPAAVSLDRSKSSDRATAVERLRPRRAAVALTLAVLKMKKLDIEGLTKAYKESPDKGRRDLARKPAGPRLRSRR